MTVLQKEMVQVQTLMDSMAREREQESEHYKHQYQELLENHTTAEVKSSQEGIAAIAIVLYHWSNTILTCQWSL